MQVRSSVQVLGVRIDCVDMPGALDRIERLIESASGCHLVATVNPEFVMRARRDAEFARLLSGAELCLADGSGVVWAARKQGCSLTQPVAGTDLVLPLAELCSRRDYPLFLLGAAEGVADDLASRLRAQHHNLRVEAYAGSPEAADDAQALRLILAHRSRVLLVAYGSPRQESWIDRHRAELEGVVAIGVGGAFDYLSGRVRRAPMWMRRARLEWLYRLIRQPWRWKRMAVLPGYALRVLLARS